MPRSRLRSLRQNFVKLHSFWIEHVFSLGDVVMDDACWALMGEIAGMLPQAKNAAVLGFDLEALQTDLTQLEALFFCQGKTVSVEEVHGWSIGKLAVSFELDEFVGCQILSLHKFNPRRILEEAETLRNDRLKAEAEQLKTKTPQKQPAKAKASA